MYNRPHRITMESVNIPLNGIGHPTVRLRIWPETDEGGGRREAIFKDCNLFQALITIADSTLPPATRTQYNAVEKVLRTHTSAEGIASQERSAQNYFENCSPPPRATSEAGSNVTTLTRLRPIGATRA